MKNAIYPPLVGVPRDRPSKSHCRASFHSAIITAPSPVFPVPVLPAIVFSGVALIVQNAHLLTEALLARHLLTPTSVERVSLSPIRRRVTARNVTLEDLSHQKLLNVAELSLTLPSWRKLDISAPRLTLFTKINGFDLARNNWSEHFDSIAQRRQDWMVPEPNSTWLSVESRAEVNPRMNWDVSAHISAITVSISTSKSDGPLLPPIPLPSIAVSSSKVTTFSEVVQIVQGLIGRAVRDAGTRSFPREFRDSAKRMARNLAVSAAEEFIVQAGAKVKKLQERVELVEDYIRDLPEGEGVRTWVGRANDLLKSVDTLLGGGKQKGSQPTTPPSRKQGAERFPVNQYRELED